MESIQKKIISLLKISNFYTQTGLPVHISSFRLKWDGLRQIQFLNQAIWLFKNLLLSRRFPCK